MQSIEFQEMIHQFVPSLSSSSVLMCSEHDPEQCHRSLLADYLSLVHHIDVIHILFNGDTRHHQVNSLARLTAEKNACIYPAISLI